MSRRPFADGRPTSTRRPGYTADQKRRRAFVHRELKDTGMYVGNKQWQAQCRICGRMRILREAEWTADHIHPVALGGAEDGPLQLACADCQRKQAAAVANMRNPRAVSRKRPEEPHPGIIR